jgi:hypothetical protein
MRVGEVAMKNDSSSLIFWGKSQAKRGQRVLTGERGCGGTCQPQRRGAGDGLLTGARPHPGFQPGNVQRTVARSPMRRAIPCSQPVASACRPAPGGASALRLHRGGSSGWAAKDDPNHQVSGRSGGSGFKRAGGWANARFHGSASAAGNAVSRSRKSGRWGGSRGWSWIDQYFYNFRGG